MAAESITFEIRLDLDGFNAELSRRLALTSATNYEQITCDIIGDFVHVGAETDILDAEYLT